MHLWQVYITMCQTAVCYNLQLLLISRAEKQNKALLIFWSFPSLFFFLLSSLFACEFSSQVLFSIQTQFCIDRKLTTEIPSVILGDNSEVNHRPIVFSLLQNPKVKRDYLPKNK